MSRKIRLEGSTMQLILGGQTLLTNQVTPALATAGVT